MNQDSKAVALIPGDGWYVIHGAATANAANPAVPHRVIAFRLHDDGETVPLVAVTTGDDLNTMVATVVPAPRRDTRLVHERHLSESDRNLFDVWRSRQ